MRRIVLTLALFAGTIHASEPQPSRQPKTLIEPSVPAQPPQPPIFRGGTNRVQIDAIVTDDNRSPVTDLRAADFELQDDGKPVPIDSVRFLGAAEYPADATLAPIRTHEDEEREASRDDVRVYAIVTVRVTRPRATVFARRGYWA